MSFALTKAGFPEHCWTRSIESPPNDWSKLYESLDRELDQAAGEVSSVRSEGINQVETFVDRFRTALSWIWCHNEGLYFAFQLWLRLKFEVFYGPHDNIRGFPRQEAGYCVNRMLGEILRRIRQHPVHLYVRGKRQSVPFIDAAHVCRVIRKMSTDFDCDRCKDRGRGCVHAEMSNPLEQLQKHAYQEVKTNVFLAVGKWLPRELADVVIEHALVVEEVPEIPVTIGPFDYGFSQTRYMRRWHTCPYGLDAYYTRYRDSGYY